MTNLITINNKRTLNRKALEQLENEYQHKMTLTSDITAFSFNGYINGNEYQNITLELKNKNWFFIDSVYSWKSDSWVDVEQKVIELKGTIEFFGINVNI